MVGPGAESARSGRLKDVSLNRLACLLRHWNWADEARIRFEGELASDWERESDPLADHLLGAYYHWCALLCGVGEAAIEQELRLASQPEALAIDLDTSLPLLRACRQVLVAIPASREDQPRIVDVIRDGETLRRLRRVHDAFGEALCEEQRFREMEFMDAHER